MMKRSGSISSRSTRSSSSVGGGISPISGARRGRNTISFTTSSTESPRRTERRVIFRVSSSNPNSAFEVTTRWGPVPRGSPAFSRAPGPSRYPGEVMKSTFGTNRRPSCLMTMIVFQQCEATWFPPPLPANRRVGLANVPPRYVELMFPYGSTWRAPSIP